MVCSGKYFKEVVLLSASPSLTLQIAQWVAKHGRYAVSLFCSPTTSGLDTALTSANRAIVDGREASAAIEAADRAARLLGSDRVAIYAESPCEHLQQWALGRGMGVLTGPMTEAEWDAFFDADRRETAA